MEDISNSLGIAPKFGGFHKTKGTKNALLDLGNEAYLELLAVDLDNDAISAPRWMGIDLISTPKITRWAVKSSDLTLDVAKLNSVAPQLAEIEEGQRITKDNQLLQWELSRPLAAPAIELLPFFIAWGGTEAHPTSFLEKGCSLESLYATHPEPERMRGMLDRIGVDLELKPSDTIGIHARIKGPKGSILI